MPEEDRESIGDAEAVGASDATTGGTGGTSPEPLHRSADSFRPDEGEPGATGMEQHGVDDAFTPSDSATAPGDEGGGSVATSSGARGRWLPILVSAIAVCGVVVMMILLVQTNRDKNDAEEARDSALAELESSKDTVRAAELATDELQAELDSANAELAGATAARQDAEQRSDEAGAELDDARAELEMTRAELDEAESAVAGFLALSLSEGGGIAEQDASCIAEHLVDEYGLAIFVEFAEAGLSGDDSQLASLGLKMLTAAEPCGIEVPELGGGTPNAFTYGDDETLDVLQDACLDGLGGACDDLFARSSAGSEYERVGATCGDRFTIADAPPTCEGSI